MAKKYMLMSTAVIIGFFLSGFIHKGVENIQLSSDKLQGMIAYVGTDGDIYLFIGTEHQSDRLTEDAQWHKYRYPKFSPDGTQLAFLKSNPEMGEEIYDLHVMDLVTRGSSVLVENVDIYDWHPDGKRIAYGYSISMNCQSPDQESTNGVMMIDLTSLDTIELVPPSQPNVPVAQPQFSVDGQYITYVNYPCFSSGFGNNVFNLQTQSSYGLGFGGVDWSPEENRLVWAQDVWADGNGGLSIITPDFSEEEEIFIDPDLSAGDPYWSPDGEKIVFKLTTAVDTFYFDMNDYPNWVSKLLVIHLDNYSVDEICRGDDQILCNFEAWSPDGHQMMFTKGTYEYPEWYLYDVNNQTSSQLEGFGIGGSLNTWKVGRIDWVGLEMDTDPEIEPTITPGITITPEATNTPEITTTPIELPTQFEITSTTEFDASQSQYPGSLFLFLIGFGLLAISLTIIILVFIIKKMG